MAETNPVEVKWRGVLFADTNQGTNGSPNPSLKFNFLLHFLKSGKVEKWKKLINFKSLYNINV
jgi:hypothetical protein